MTKPLSLYLDILRIAAALAVFVAHAIHPHFGALPFNPADVFDYGSDAVILFFVLSGFVIAYTADARDGSARVFLFNRATRLVSVVAPAIALTIAADAIGQALAPGLYDTWRNGAPAAGPGAYLLGLSLTNEWAWAGVHVGSNHPLWSVSYEAAYYLIFASMMYLQGAARLVAVIAGLLIAGPNILLLAPAWGLGVFAYRVVRTAPARERPVWLWALIALAAAALYFQLNADDVDLFALRVTAHVLDDHPLRVFRYSGEFAWSWFIAGLAALHIVAVARICLRIGAPSAGRRARRSRFTPRTTRC
ncbi:MAG: acyltransferase family protein [Pseudomonadota bacterium]